MNSSLHRSKTFLGFMIFSDAYEGLMPTASPQLRENFSVFRELVIRPCPFFIRPCPIHCCEGWNLRSEDLPVQCSREQIECMRWNTGI